MTYGWLGTAASGCADNSTAGAATGITYITGVAVPAAAITVDFGCGAGDGQVYKYVAIARGVVAGRDIAGLYDCFADAVFTNLPTVPDGGVVTISVRAFTKSAFDGAGTFDVGSMSTSAIQSLPATWATECTAVLQQDVRVVAVCPPLAPQSQSVGDGGSAGSDAAVGAEAGASEPDGGSDTHLTDGGDAAVGTDAGNSASTPDGGDASRSSDSGSDGDGPAHD